MLSADVTPSAVVFGCAGLELMPDERRLFADAQPFGFILFRRNCESPDQVRQLVRDLRTSVGRPDAPVLIDQEGGRVARLRPPHWPAHPPVRRIGDLADNSLEEALEAARLNGALLAAMLADLGIDVDCAPVCDVPVPGSHDIIGDRAFAEDPHRVAQLARAFAEGMLDGGVLPIIKHIPGHGRALADSHLDLPVVDAPREELEASDFVPFRALADMPLGMTAHVVYRALDTERPVTLSPTAIAEVIRKHIGFDGLLFSDDLSMHALDRALPGQDMGARAKAVLAAGVDVALHCNGDMAEMRSIAEAVPLLSPEAQRRWGKARERMMRACTKSVDVPALRTRFAALMGEGTAVA